MSLPDVNPADFNQLVFDNLVDHFDMQNNSTFEQRYWVNDDYWTDETGPNFIYICGEYTCSVRADRMYPYMVGASHGARLFALEHRFYGASQPYDDWSLQSLEKLSSEQAMADLAYFIAKMNEDYPERQTVVIGGSYPGALSAWFRSRYPQSAVASWAASGVVQPIGDYWQYDEQIYLSSLKSGAWCPALIAAVQQYATSQAALRLNGMTNDIDIVLTNTGVEDMRTDDFMNYMGDMPAGYVQYGQRTEMCDYLEQYKTESLQYSFRHIVWNQIASGNSPASYDTRPGSKITSTAIDVNDAGRQWTYQVCTEFGFFQTPSEIHPMRSALVKEEYWIDYCKRVFDGLDMVNKPLTWQSDVDQGGFGTAGSNIFFTNGSEDPWQWATQRVTRDDLNQVGRMSDCTDCGHCADLYTPKDTDPVSLQETRTMVADWISDVLANTTKTQTSFLQ